MTKGERTHINIYLHGYIMEDVRHIKICFIVQYGK